MSDVGDHVGAAVVRHDFVRTLDGLRAPDGADVILAADEQSRRGERLALLVGQVVPVVVDVVVEAQRPAEPGTFEFASVEIEIGLGDQAGMVSG